MTMLGEVVQRAGLEMEPERHHVDVDRIVREVARDLGLSEEENRALIQDVDRYWQGNDE
jgi:chromosome condensin MukBEF complex kleisin-like MukF subunit